MNVYGYFLVCVVYQREEINNSMLDVGRYLIQIQLNFVICNFFIILKSVFVGLDINGRTVGTWKVYDVSVHVFIMKDFSK